MNFARRISKPERNSGIARLKKLDVKAQMYGVEAFTDKELLEYRQLCELTKESAEFIAMAEQMSDEQLEKHLQQLIKKNRACETK